MSAGFPAFVKGVFSDIPYVDRLKAEYRYQNNRVCCRRVSGRSWLSASTSCDDPWQSLTLPQEIEHWALWTLREKLIKIGAKVVRHGRHITFQLAEVAIP